MSAECHPMSMLHVSRLMEDYLAQGDDAAGSVRGWFAAAPLGAGWMSGASTGSNREELAAALRQQAGEWDAGSETLANIQRLRNGAHAVITGQQVGLLGGPLLTLLKAATAVARAREATRTTGAAHVPVFWLASEDHDLAEVDQVSLLTKHAVETLRLGLRGHGSEVGGLALEQGIEPLLDHASELLSWSPASDLLRACYTPGNTLAGAFGRWMTQLFAAHGLIVLDAAGREFHRLGARALRGAIERAAELEAALLDRGHALESAGYHTQVLVKPGASLLFLLDGQTGARIPLRRTTEGGWKAGNQALSTAELLAILDETPERISPNALLRPVFQDTILPTAAYIGGPAEIAYFAQSEVLYRALLGRVTPVLPRFSATLVEPAVATVMAKDEVSLADVYDAKTVDALTQRLGARAMPIEGKRRLAAAGNAMDAELTALTAYMTAMDAGLGRSADVSASKMRYQMQRLRRMAATYETQREGSLRRHAETVMLHLLPGGHPQERVLAGAWFLSQGGLGLVDRLVDESAAMCLGHSVLYL